MGNFYVNLTVRATNREEIRNLLAGRDALISPVLEGDVVVVYDKEADLQYWPLIEPVVQSLSEKLATVVLTVINHDDGMLAYVLYERGKHVDTYNSAPDYFEATSDKRGPMGGDPALLCNAFGSRSLEAVKAVLQKPMTAIGSLIAAIATSWRLSASRHRRSLLDIIIWRPARFRRV